MKLLKLKYHIKLNFEKKLYYVGNRKETVCDLENFLTAIEY